MNYTLDELIEHLRRLREDFGGHTMTTVEDVFYCDSDIIVESDTSHYDKMRSAL